MFSNYIGQTLQYVGDRIRQHRSSLNKLARGDLRPGEYTGVTQHIRDNPNHNIMFDDTVILEREKGYHRRLLKEAIHIYTTSNSINLQTDVKDHVVSTVYSRFINQFCKKNTWKHFICYVCVTPCIWYDLPVTVELLPVNALWCAIFVVTSACFDVNVRLCHFIWHKCTGLIM